MVTTEPLYNYWHRAGSITTGQITDTTIMPSNIAHPNQTSQFEISDGTKRIAAKTKTTDTKAFLKRVKGLVHR